MPRLPVQGSDEGVWGTILNTYLSVAHDVDGTLKSGVVGTAAVQDAAITEAKLSAAIQAKLNAVLPVRFSAPVAAIAVTGSDRAAYARTLTGARMRVSSAPSGSNLVAAVQYSTDGGSNWTTLGTLTITDGSSTEATATFSRTQSAGELLRLNVTSVGSLTPALGVVVDILWSA